MRFPFFAFCALVFAAAPSCRAQTTAPRDPALDEPKTYTVYTSTREIRALKFVNKQLWAATAGGVLRYDKGWTKWTRRTGLPSNEAFDLDAKEGQIEARFPLQTAVFNGSGWVALSAKPFQKSAATATWNGKKVVATLDGLTIGERKIPNPPAPGTHISALLVERGKLLVGFYGDGLWIYDGVKWTAHPLNAKLNPEAREVTALASNGAALFIGTRRAGVWASSRNSWRPLGTSSGAEIYNANIQVLGLFNGSVWGSTLDDGLVIKGHENWGHVTTPTISTTAPRQMLEWQGQLYVRHGSGVVDSFDGRNWTKDALKTIPRKGVYALATDEKQLYAAGWGGWSEWDGRNWTPHFDVPQLKGVPLMGLLADGSTVWIATQSRGLGRFDHTRSEFRWFDERDGLPDDWVTALTKFDGKIYAGTFVGGLARLDGEKWKTFEELKGENVTSLAADKVGLVAATRNGLWRIEGDRATKVKKSWLDTEVQALQPGVNGLWVGARTSLSFLKLESKEERGALP